MTTEQRPQQFSNRQGVEPLTMKQEFTGKTSVLLTDRDFLEMLMHKLSVMKNHGQAWFARKMQVDERLYTAARKDLNEFYILLRKRGYDGNRFDIPPPEQGKLL